MLISPQENPRFSQEDLDFVVANHKLKTPKDLAKSLNKHHQVIYMHMKKYGLIPCVNRPIKSRVIVDKYETIAKVIEDYVTTQDGLRAIAKRHKIDVQKISNWIRDHYFGVPRNDNSETITLQSKV